MSRLPTRTTNSCMITCNFTDFSDLFGKILVPTKMEKKSDFGKKLCNFHPNWDSIFGFFCYLVVFQANWDFFSANWEKICYRKPYPI